MSLRQRHRGMHKLPTLLAMRTFTVFIVTDREEWETRDIRLYVVVPAAEVFPLFVKAYLQSVTFAIHTGYPDWPGYAMDRFTEAML